MQWSMMAQSIYSQPIAYVQQQQQQGRCRILRINPQQPSGKIQAEAGVTEFYDHNDVQFQCAGVAVLRHTIKPRGFLLPSYTNAPLLVYVARVNGFDDESGRRQGIFAGLRCLDVPKHSSHPNLSLIGHRGSKTGIRRSDSADRVTFLHSQPGQLTGSTMREIKTLFWLCCKTPQTQSTNLTQNAGSGIQTDFMCVNEIAGNPEGQSQEQQQGQQVQWGKNIFRGFDVKTLSEAFNVDKETARKLQSEDDQRGHIVEVDQGLHVLRPPTTQEQEVGQWQGYNGLEETICTARLREIIDNPSRTDIYNHRPQAGRFHTVNSLKLPILSFFRLRAERGVLYKNAVFAPHWYVNANGVMYVTRGEGRVQIVDHRGQCVLDEQLSEGQVVVVPMNYAVVEQAGNNQGFEWVGFNTNDNAMINTIAGRSSTFRGLPTSVVANALQIWEDEAQQLKFNRVETMIFSRDPRF
nr:LOW QUALITY PROTEIN: 12S seed storage globulin 1-like [Coffea arabica]